VNEAARAGEAQRTDPRGLLVTGLRGAAQSVLPIAAMAYGSGALVWGALMIVPAAAAIIAVSVGIAWFKWTHFAYTTGAEDIRVEHGLFSRHARSVPYQRIQDVSLEQKFLPRLLGLAEVRFETGAGGKDEITLSYLSLEEGERLRELVRARKDGVAAAVAPEQAMSEEREAAPLFAMDLRRIVTFGLFQFSLVVFAVLMGAATQFDFRFPDNLWDFQRWYNFALGEAELLTGMGRGAQVLAVGAGVLLVVALGVLSGIAVTLAREYGFRLDRTPKGFRRRRGLFNRTDVLLPAHRVQAARIGTRLIRARFGWHSLEFVSLAQDLGGSSHHAVAPFAKLDEIWPVARAAGIEPPGDDLAWHRSSPVPWRDDTILHGAFFAILGVVGWGVTRNPWSLAIGVGLIAVTAPMNYLGWRRRRHAENGSQLFVALGRLAPRLNIVPNVKLQSVEIVQGPLGRWRGHATLHLGLAGDTLSIPRIPLDEARALRAAIVEQVAEVDFSRLPR
jgi:putative membrane protein